ncbi:hypothetical protein C8F01DRAFT_268271 [Mycena amicta]|nr:hypothetical protein C8F01DRAFT_268271 [Mycena amicta]
MGLGVTLTSGIQDISGFLPIFGTDQCERHIGSALEGGYLYAAATPLSLFGCLGIIKASLAILFASITYPFNGARVLHDAGFELVGSAAGMIGISADKRFEFEAASRISACMPESPGGGTMYYTRIAFRFSEWNKAFVAVTLPLSGMAITPYLAIIIRDHGAVSSWIYPALRITGSALCALCAQFTLQRRIRRILRDNMPNEDRVSIFSHDSLVDSDSLLLWILRASLALGIGATAVGYIGCFNLVQTASPNETLLWLGLEAALCLIRIFLWSINPNWDEDMYATLALRWPVRPKTRTTTSLAYEDLLPCENAKGLPFSVELPRHFIPRKGKRSRRLFPNVEPGIWRPIRYAAVISLAGDCLYLFTVCFPKQLASGRNSDTRDAFGFIQKTGDETPIAFHDVHALHEPNTLQTMFQLGQKIEASEVIRRLQSGPSEHLNSRSKTISLVEPLRNIIQYSATIISQLPDLALSATEVTVSLGGKLRGLRWEKRVGVLNQPQGSLRTQ